MHCLLTGQKLNIFPELDTLVTGLVSYLGVSLVLLHIET